MRRTLFILLFVLSAAGAAFPSDKADAVQSAYRNLKDISGVFEQTSILKDLKKEQNFKGEFLVKFPSRMRYVYKAGSQDEIVINGSSIIIYQKKENQALKSGFNRDTYGAAPVSLLTGLADLKEDFSIEEKNGKLLLRPKAAMGGIELITLEVDEKLPFPIKSLSIYDQYSNEVRLRLKNVRVNTGIKEHKFQFSAPPGVKIHDFGQ